MTPSGTAGASDDASEGLSLKDAAEIYNLSLRTLSNRVRNGEVQAFKRRAHGGTSGASLLRRWKRLGTSHGRTHPELKQRRRRRSRGFSGT